MNAESKTPGGWKSRTLWAFLILVALTLLFLAAWLWLARYAGDIALELALEDKEVPNLYTVLVQSFPIGALVTGLGAAGAALIGGNKARDATRNLRKEEK